MTEMRLSALDILNAAECLERANISAARDGLFRFRLPLPLRKSVARAHLDGLVVIQRENERGEWVDMTDDEVLALV